MKPSKETQTAAIILLSAIIVYLPLLTWLLGEYLRNPWANHGLIVPIATAYILYKRLKDRPIKISQSQESTIIGALTILVAVCVRFLAGSSITAMTSLILYLFGATILFYGAASLSASLPALLYLLFMYPIDVEALYSYGTGLSILTGKLSRLGLSILGIPVLYTENPLPTLTIASKTGETAPFMIDVPCMGAQQVIGYVAFAVFLMLVTEKPSLVHKGLSFILGLLLMPVLNVLRVIAILLIAYEYGTEAALNTFHTFGGWILFTTGIIIYLLLIEWLSKRPSLKIDLRQLIKPLVQPGKIKTALLIVIITGLTLCIIPQSAVNKEIDKTIMVTTSGIKSTLAGPQLVDRNRNKIEGSFEAEKQEKIPVMIGFEDTPLPQLVVSVGGEIKYVYRIIAAIAAKVPEAAVSKLRSARGVAYVEPDGQVYTVEQTLPWGVDRIDADKIHTLGGKGTTIKVAILDTGIDYNHPDLDANYKSGYDYVNNDPDPMDDNGHGTHVAGIVAAEDNNIGVIGVAPEAHLYAVKVLDSEGYGYLSDVVKGIEWSIVNGMKIISMSLGTDTDYQSLHDAVDAAYYDNGILVVAAAGNDGNLAGTTDTVDYPARYGSVIAVGATDENDERAMSWPWWASSTGPDLELAAPGDNINSTLLGGGYGTKSGTSMSCPHVTGTAALVFSLLDINPSDDLDGDGVWDANEVRKKLQDTAEDLGAIGRDTHYGYGLVDAEAAATPPPGASPPYYIPELPFGTILALLTALLIAAVYRRRRKLAALP